MIRRPIVNGQFYSANFNSLNKQIESCFLHKLGPGELPTKRKNKIIYGIIAPHAGYEFSGPCQAWAYKEIAESTFYNYIILGTNHTGLGNPVSLDKRDYETPFGVIRNNRDLAKEILKNNLIKEDEAPHTYEHSIEVQLPFLQYVNKDKLQDLTFNPIVINPLDYESYKNLAKTLAKTNSIIIVSSDFTHYGPSYNYTPFVYNKKQEMYKLDKKAIEYILDLDTKGFLDYIKKTRASICGNSGIALLIEIMKIKKAKARLLSYYTSGDIIKDYTNAVGYASIIFE